MYIHHVRIMLLNLDFMINAIFFYYLQNRASDVPKLKGEKELKELSLRVKNAAEGLLTVIMDHVVGISVMGWFC